MNQIFSMSQPTTINDQPSTSHENEVLVRVNGVSKKFCRDLKKSLWYGIKDVAAELFPFGKKSVASCQLPVDGKEKTNNFQSPTTNQSPSLRDGEFWANKGISFELRRGECIGLIGHNGAGKTTLLKMLNGLIKPDEGTIEMRGRVGALIALGAGFNPILTGRENIYVNGSILGMSKDEIDAKFDEIVEFSEIGDFIDAPVQSYSSGMNVRLGFAVATALSPDVLIVDEVLAVGDYRFRWKCLQRIKKLRESGVSIILVSHNAADLMRTCDRGLVLNRGEVLFQGPIQEALHEYEKVRSTDNSGTIANFPPKNARIEKISIHADSERAPSSFVADILIHSDERVDRMRLVLGFFHSHCGSLFHVSSFCDKNWLSLKEGLNEIKVHISGFTLQSGTCSLEASLRGENISDIHDIKQSSNSISIIEPEPNYEGFGINGVILPKITWNI
jgi:lipopolysaccharide transport system ATP-binding protein